MLLPLLQQPVLAKILKISPAEAIKNTSQTLMSSHLSYPNIHSISTKTSAFMTRGKLQLKGTKTKSLNFMFACFEMHPPPSPDLGFVFIDDNAPVNTLSWSMTKMKLKIFGACNWFAHTPDLNPIEHVWDMLGRQIVALPHLSTSISELKRTLRFA
ncbi:hypothetical protein TNCV_1878191 [Trichonephila clavipes]|nr:hypothetical protein TNCV_1878191 [Trichonephila clavipes]